jgi:hypothetical protein
MKVYRSEFWTKDKVWYSDYPAEDESTYGDRLNFDILKFCQETKKDFLEVKKMMHQSTDIPKCNWFIQFGFSMVDHGLIEV